MSIELELKLKIAEKDIPQFMQHPLLLNKALPTEHLVTTYLDTKDQLLKKRGFVLRIRSINDTFIQTVKTSSISVNGLHKREEWENVVSNLTPDFNLFPDATLKQELLTTELGQQVHPVFVSDFMRTRWNLVSPAGDEIELALDQGFVAAGALKDPFTEIELELKSGEAASIDYFAKLLAENIELIPENSSKAGRGYRLAMLQALSLNPGGV